ncbi:hypothetical protein SPRG_13423 [Saprolegnia parasitica CBS 223.65]|uniref:dolichyl-phosphate beta-D-mannosyltransferase n=1 Tax=Saprolegnia parasitica (strain CBS 223.65) TaxID=695850 RepID=A0A067C2C8_SAPPC|nr:hypothetical protein SPRG_13423 [Saprolegnia parasitica CBS 223.65]KDO20671.1 hypothetical protein SPRG_13423 [Saprolegnia parasitica CBS 223.65]|eukprot:XP_012208636.1 hypothetical protein SPRG_13423 [Saprolegnia parasitica CBS 223.65]
MVQKRNVVSILLPTWNEQETLPLVVWHIHEACTERLVDYELVIVEDNSDDGSLQVAQKLQGIYGSSRLVIVARKGRLGLFSALVDGLLKATGDYIVVLPANFTQHPKYIPHLVAQQEATQADIVASSRFGDDHNGVCGWSFGQRLQCCVKTVLADLLFSLRLSDPTSSYRLYKRQVFAQLVHALGDTRTADSACHLGLAFAVAAQSMHCTVAEVPVTAMQPVYSDKDDVALASVGRFAVHAIGLYLRQ